MRRRVVRAEAMVENLNSEIARLDAALAAPELFTRDPAKAAEFAKARAVAVGALAKAEEEWLAASAEYEAANT